MTKRPRSLLIIVLITATAWLSRDILAQETLRSPTALQESQQRGEELLQQTEPRFEFLNSLVEEALRVNPSIQGARQNWQAATKRPSQVSSLPNPELSFGSMSTGNPLPYSTVGNGPLSWASFMFKQRIPWPGKLDLKGEIAETEASRTAHLYRATALRVTRELKQAYFDLHYVDRAQEVIRRYRDLLEKFSRIAEARYAVGEGIQADVLRSQVEISLIAERLEVLEERRLRVQARINSLLNRSPDRDLPWQAPSDFSSLSLPFSLERLYLMAREQNPSIEAGRLDIQKASLKLDLAKKRFFPNLSLSTNYLLRAGPFDNMYEYRVGLEIPLYFWRKERFGVEENVEELQESRHDYRARLQEVTFKIKDAYIGARTAQRLAKLYREGIIPQAAASLDSSLSAYEVGSVDFLTLVENALTILNYELQYHEETRDYLQNLVGLEEQIGAVVVK